MGCVKYCAVLAHIVEIEINERHDLDIIIPSRLLAENCNSIGRAMCVGGGGRGVQHKIERPRICTKI